MPRPAFSRTGKTSPFGKLGPSIGALRLGQLTEERLREEAARAGVSMGEFVRQLVEIRLHGRSAVDQEISMRLDIVDGRDKNATR